MFFVAIFYDYFPDFSAFEKNLIHIEYMDIVIRDIKSWIYAKLCLRKISLLLAVSIYIDNEPTDQSKGQISIVIIFS